MNVLLTGGAGYIGSHAAVEVSKAGHNIVILDNFSNSNKSVPKRLKSILGKEIRCIEGDVCDAGLMTKILQDYKIEAVIHFAGLKSVNESFQRPIDYYVNNVQGTLSLLVAMKLAGVKKLIFSSSATVYGSPIYLPIDENHPTLATNPYGRSKLHVEEMLKDVAYSDPEWRIICLRYFNPVGAHESGLIGEDPSGVPNNLMPYIAQVATGRAPILSIFGDDYKTIDGTGVRDYIHVEDLASGHLAALEHLQEHIGWTAINLGSGSGYTVLEVVQAYRQVTGLEIPYQIKSRRAGDIAICFAAIHRAKGSLNWAPIRDLNQMCESSCLWQKNIISK